MQKRTPTQIAIIGPTACGKSALALKLADDFDGIILSLDSLALYREIDIASAKPTPEERGEIPHYGIDLIDPDQPFDVTRFAELYREVAEKAVQNARPLIIVGGSSFYLKILLEGLSPLPPIEPEIRRRVDTLLGNPDAARAVLTKRAPQFARRLAPSDRYRMEKGLIILLQTGQDPAEYFRQNPPQPVIDAPLPLYEIVMPRQRLRERIAHRTDAMIASGLIDEVTGLEYRYGRAPQSMKAIGIVEVLAYLDGRLDLRQMREKIITNTARLAKRQSTFNRSQFMQVCRDETEKIEEKIRAELQKRRWE